MEELSFALPNVTWFEFNKRFPAHIKCGETIRRRHVTGP